MFPSSLWGILDYYFKNSVNASHMSYCKCTAFPVSVVRTKEDVDCLIGYRFTFLFKSYYWAAIFTHGTDLWFYINQSVGRKTLKTRKSLPMCKASDTHC